MKLPISTLNTESITVLERVGYTEQTSAEEVRNQPIEDAFIIVLKVVNAWLEQTSRESGQQ